MMQKKIHSLKKLQSKLATLAGQHTYFLDGDIRVNTYIKSEKRYPDLPMPMVLLGFYCIIEVAEKLTVVAEWNEEEQTREFNWPLPEEQLDDLVASINELCDWVSLKAIT